MQGFTSVTDFFTKIKNTSGFPTQDLYRDGVLTYPDGRQEVFVKGNTLSQLLEYSQKKEAEEKAALAKKIEEVNLRLILENEACTIRNFLKGNVKSIELCYEEMCLTLLANYSEDGRIISTGGGYDYRGNIISEERDEELITYKIEYWD